MAAEFRQIKKPKPKSSSTETVYRTWLL